VPACVRLHLIFQAIAPQFQHVHFTRILRDDFKSTFDPAALPTFLIYRGSKMTTSMVAVAGDLGPDFTDGTVVNFLNKYGLCLHLWL